MGLRDIDERSFESRGDSSFREDQRNERRRMPG